VSESPASSLPAEDWSSTSSSSSSSSLRPSPRRPQQQPSWPTTSPQPTWSCVGTSLHHQHPGPSWRHHRPQRRYLHRPPPTSQIHKTPAAELLEADTCPTSTSTGAAHLHEEALGTRTDAHVPARNQQPRESHDVTTAKQSKRPKVGPRTYRVSRPLQRVCLGALLDLHFPRIDLGNSVHHLLLEDLAVDFSGGVRLPPVLLRGVNLVLDRLNQPPGKRPGN
jgi:hypothetical protein